jgi:haloalkane dehalogenase
MSTRSLPDWLVRLYPFAPRSFLTPPGAQMSYVDTAPAESGGEAVLMLHGNPTWSFYFRELIAALAPTHRCIVPDHIGMGLSEKPENYAYTLERRIGDIESLVAKLGLQRVHLVVHDWGGAIGFGFATRNRHLVGRIVILNTAAFTSDLIPARIALCRAPLIGPLLVRGLNGFAGPATWMSMHRRKLTREERAGFLFPYRSWADRVAVNAFVQDIPMDSSHPSWPTLRKIEERLELFRDSPVQIVWGGKDFCFNDAFLERWRAFLPRARVHRIADAGHYVLTDAREEAVPLIAEFFAPRF